MGIHYESGIRPEVFEWIRFDERRAKDIAVGPQGAVWIVGMEERVGGYRVARWTGLGWEPYDAGAVVVEVAPSGDAWLITDEGELLEPADGGWRACPTPAPVRDVSIAPLDGGVWIVTSAQGEKPGKVLRRAGSDWVENYSTATHVPFQWDVVGSTMMTRTTMTRTRGQGRGGRWPSPRWPMGSPGW